MTALRITVAALLAGAMGYIAGGDAAQYRTSQRVAKAMALVRASQVIACQCVAATTDALSKPVNGTCETVLAEAGLR